MTREELIAKKKWAEDRAIYQIAKKIRSEDEVANDLILYERFLYREFARTNPSFLRRMWRKLFYEESK